MVPIALVIAALWLRGQLLELPADPRVRVVLAVGHTAIIGLAAVGACRVAELLGAVQGHF